MANEAKQFTIGGVTHDVMDVGARQAIASLQNAIDAITSGDTTTAIKTFQEVINFLDGVTDDETLIGKLNELRTLINAKYSKPASGIPASDLADGVIPDVSGFATKTEVNAKANSADVYTKTEVDTKVAEASSGAVSVTTNQDGTFVIHVGETDYTINLNHTHEGMAKVVVDTDANLPDPGEMDEDTVYGVLDNGALVALYVGGYPFYAGSGGGTPLPPALISPTEDLDLGTIQNGTASGTIFVKGKRLTAPLTLSFTANSGFTFDTSGTLPTGVSVDNSGVMTITAESVIAGVTIPILYTGNDLLPEDTLTIESITDAIDESITVSASGYADISNYTNGVEDWALEWNGNIELVKDKAMIVAEGTTNNIEFVDAPGYCLIKFQPVQATSQKHKIHYGYNPVTVANSLTINNKRCRMAAHSYSVLSGTTGEGALFRDGRFEMDKGSNSSIGTNSKTWRVIDTSNISHDVAVSTYVIATLSMEALTDCYVYCQTNSTYIWNPFNNDQSLDT